VLGQAGRRGVGEPEAGEQVAGGGLGALAVGAGPAAGVLGAGAVAHPLALPGAGVPAARPGRLPAAADAHGACRLLLGCPGLPSHDSHDDQHSST
jgi:hypothetical protein